MKEMCNRCNRCNRIDFVVTWVDGGDEVWLRERKKYERDVEGSAVSKNRFRDWDLLKYWFRGVEKFAPFVDNVFFVTYGHVPAWLNVNSSKLRIVKHEDFIPTKYLPTYNSVAIELNLHRIKGLSEKFVYFNDDMFLCKPISERVFFVGDKVKYNFIESAMVSYGGLNRTYRDMLMNTTEVLNRNFRKTRVKNLSFRDWETFINNMKAIRFGKYIGFASHHSAHGFLKTTFREMWEKEGEELDNTCRAKFRTRDIITPDIIELWQACSGKTQNYNHRRVEKYYNLGMDDVERIVEDLEQQKYRIMCLNDECSDEDFDRTQRAVAGAFEKILGEKSQFEL